MELQVTGALSSGVSLGGTNRRTGSLWSFVEKNIYIYYLYQKERKSQDVLFLQLLAQVLGTRMLSGSAAPEQQHCAGEPQWSGKEPGVQRARNTWGKKSFMNSFSCNIAEIKLFLTVSRDL